MTNENSIDKLFRDGLKEREYAFHEAYWVEAEALIVSQLNQHKKRLLYIFSYILALLTVISIPILVLTLFDVQPNLQTVSVLHQTQTQTQTQGPTQINNQTVNPQPSTVNSTNRSSQPQPTASNQTQSPAIIAGPLTTSTQSPANPSLQPDPSSGAGEETGAFGLTMGAPEIFLQQSQVHNLFALTSLTERSFGLKPTMPHAVSPLVELSELPYARHHFSFAIGANLNPVWNNTQEEFGALSSHPFWGLRYAYTLNPRLNLTAGLYYQGRGGLGSDTLIQMNQFDFGLSRETVRISNQRLHYVEVPLGLDLRVSDRHYVLAGLSASYLINSSGQEERTTFQSLGSPMSQNQQVWGYKEGFRNWDASLQLGYAYYLNRGIRTGIQLNYGLNDLTQNQYYGNQRINRNTQIRWFLELYLHHF